jgi:hypothetical protein
MQMKLEAILWMLVLVSLALAIVSRRYRKYGAFVIGITVVAAAAIIVFARNNEISTPASIVPAQHSSHVDFEQFHVEKLDKEDPEAKTRIDVSEIRFDQIIPSPGTEAGTFESVRARLYNDSARFALTDYGYYLAVQDCIANACTTIYDQRGLESAAVPANQARDVKIAIRPDETHVSPPFKLQGTARIILMPSATRASKAASVP